MTTETMTTTITETAPEPADVALPLSDDQVPLVAELIALALTSNHLIDRRYIRMHAMLDDSGAIALTIAGVGTDFLADDTVRVLLTISDPITVVPVPGDPSTEIGGVGMSHWLTRFDPDDGEPYGTVCDCEIDFHHNGFGQPTDPDDIRADDAEGTDVEIGGVGMTAAEPDVVPHDGDCWRYHDMCALERAKIALETHESYGSEVRTRDLLAVMRMAIIDHAEHACPDGHACFAARQARAFLAES